MRLAPAVAALALAVLSASCSPPQCKGIACDSPDAAVDAGSGLACRGGCSGARPVCNGATGYCGVCNDTQGCSGARPACDVTADNGLGACLPCTATKGCPALSHCYVGPASVSCVECLEDAHCPFGACDVVNHWCVGRRDAGVPDAGPGDGGAQTDGGGVADGGGAADGGAADGGVVRPDAGVCIVHPPPVGCTVDCTTGFHCTNGQCVLNGGTGPVQVTLRWNTAEDVDLHVIEPTPSGPCDIYYGNRQGSSCGAVGTLDLDSNAGCSIDNVDIENVIYSPDASVPSGTYTVRVDHWSNCSPATTWVPFEVEVRNNGVISGYCGSFVSGGPGWNNHGSSGSGASVMTFIVP